jgi:DNA-binding MarR family transcriptional regulator
MSASLADLARARGHAQDRAAVVRALQPTRELSFRDLREATGLDRARLSNALVSLEIRALVEARKADDSRNRYKLTRTGRAQVEAVNGAMP